MKKMLGLFAVLSFLCMTAACATTAKHNGKTGGMSCCCCDMSSGTMKGCGMMKDNAVSKPSEDHNGMHH